MSLCPPSPDLPAQAPLRLTTQVPDQQNSLVRYLSGQTQRCQPWQVPAIYLCSPVAGTRPALFPPLFSAPSLLFTLSEIRLGGRSVQKTTSLCQRGWFEGACICADGTSSPRFSLYDCFRTIKTYLSCSVDLYVRESYSKYCVTCELCTL